MQRSRPGDDMIERAEHVRNYTTIQNELIQDNRISFEARALMLFMLSLPDDWDFSTRGLATLTGLSTGTISRLSQELEQFGYLERNAKREGGRFASYDWTIREEPSAPRSISPHTEKLNTVTAFRKTAHGSTEHGKTERKQNTKYNKVLNKQSTKEKSIKEKTATRFTPPTVEEVRAYCQERGNSIDPEAFVAFYRSKGWKVGSNPMKDWRAAVITWEKREGKSKAKTQPLNENPFTKLRREEGYE